MKEIDLLATGAQVVAPTTVAGGTAGLTITQEGRTTVTSSLSEKATQLPPDACRNSDQDWDADDRGVHGDKACPRKHHSDGDDDDDDAGQGDDLRVLKAR